MKIAANQSVDILGQLASWLISNDDELINQTEAAGLLNCSRQRIAQLINQGKLLSFTKYNLVRKSDVLNLNLRSYKGRR